MFKRSFLMMLLCSIFFVTAQLSATVDMPDKTESICKVEAEADAVNYLAQYYNTSTSDVTVSFLGSSSGNTVYSFRILSTNTIGRITETDRGEFIVDEDIEGL